MTAKLQLSNPREPSLEPLEVSALADTGSVFLCIPEHVSVSAEARGDRAVARSSSQTARARRTPTSAQSCCASRTASGFVGALVLGDEVLLGAIPMEEMDLIVNPRDRSVDVNPDSPNIATGICKRAA